MRAYLCAFEAPDGSRSWLVLDDEGTVVSARRDVRDVVAIAALCEIAEESAAGGDLDELLSQLVALRLTESPEGIDEAEDAVRALQRTIGTPPQLASPARLDEIGAATRRLEHALDPAAPSPFTAALKSCPGHDRRAPTGDRAAPIAYRFPRDRVSQRVAVRLRYPGGMEGGGFFPFGGDPEEILRGLREFAETQSESVKDAQREQFATLTLSTAVELTAAALKQVQPTGGPDEQAAALRDAMRVLFPEAVALVSAARQGFMRET